MFSLICVWTNGWVNNRESGDLRRHRTVMWSRSEGNIRSCSNDRNSIPITFLINVLTRWSNTHGMNITEIAHCRNTPERVVGVRKSWRTVRNVSSHPSCVQQEEVTLNFVNGTPIFPDCHSYLADLPLRANHWFWCELYSFIYYELILTPSNCIHPFIFQGHNCVDWRR